jgi:hypothetical protein
VSSSVTIAPHRDQEFAMSIPCKFERSILSYDEHKIILRSHHPEIYDAGLDDLKTLYQASARYAQ